MLLALFAFCTAQAHSVEQDNCPKVKIAYYGPVNLKKLDIFSSNFSGIIQIANEIFDPLFHVTREKKFIPLAAESWNYSDNNQAIIFHLRKDGSWSDGKPVTANDFIAGFKAAVDSDGKSRQIRWDSFRGMDAWLKDKSTPFQPVTQQDKYTIVLHLSDAKHFDLGSLAAIKPIPTHLNISATNPWGAQQMWVSNGPYQVVDNTAGNVELAKNPHYWDLEAIHLDRLVYTATPLDKSLKHYLDNDVGNEIDVLLDTPLRQLDWVNNYLESDVVDSRHTTLLYIAFDTRKSVLSNPKIRQAIELATDREKTLRSALNETGSPSRVVTSFFKPEPPSLPRMEKLNAARKMMKDLGYGPDNRLEFTFGYYAIDPFENVARSAAEQWADIWVDVKTVSIENNFGDMMNAFTEGQFDATVFTRNRRLDQEPSVLSRLVQPSLWNGFYDNPELSQLLQSASGHYPKPLYHKQMQTLENKLVNAAPIVSIGWWKNKVLRKPYITGVQASADRGLTYGRHWKCDMEKYPRY